MEKTKGELDRHSKQQALHSGGVLDMNAKSMGAAFGLQCES